MRYSGPFFRIPTDGELQRDRLSAINEDHNDWHEILLERGEDVRAEDDDDDEYEYDDELINEDADRQQNDHEAWEASL